MGSRVSVLGDSFGENIIVTNPCDWCQLTLSSSDPTDVINQATGKFTFSTLGTHTITAQLNMGEGGTKTATTTVTVVAAPAALAATRYQASPAPRVALLLLLLGVGLVLRHRSSREA